MQLQDAARSPGGNFRFGSKFHELERQRRTLSLTLTALILIAYFGFILLLAFGRQFMAQTVYGVITIGFPIGVGVIVFAILLTGIYVWRANSAFDRLTREIVEERL